MSVPKEAEVEIRRLHYAEHCKVGTISSQLGIHADFVRRELGLLAPRSRSNGHLRRAHVPQQGVLHPLGRPLTSIRPSLTSAVRELFSAAASLHLDCRNGSRTPESDVWRTGDTNGDYELGVPGLETTIHITEGFFVQYTDCFAR